MPVPFTSSDALRSWRWLAPWMLMSAAQAGPVPVVPGAQLDEASIHRAILEVMRQPSFAVQAGVAVRAEPGSGSLLGSAIARAGKIDLMQQGIEASRQAILECIKGDYPGGGLGLASMPLARPTARTDHCRH